MTPGVVAPTPHAAGDHDALRLVALRCDVCGADDAEPLSVGEDFEYRTSRDTFLAVRCRRCGLVYLNPRPASDELPRIYPPDYHAYDFSSARYGLAYAVRCRLERYRLARWTRALAPDARVLDIGCGDGFHLRLLRTFGAPTWQLEGVDASETAVAAAGAAGLRVHHGTIEDLPLDRGAYDLVLLVATLEHVGSPRDVLRRVRDVLRPGGRVVIVTDNVRTLSFAVSKSRHWGGYHFPRHWHLFTQETLRTLAHASELDVERMRTIVTPVNWVYTLHNALADYGASPNVLRHVSLSAAPALALFTAVNAVEQLVGYGGLLEAVLRRPGDGARDAAHERG